VTQQRQVYLCGVCGNMVEVLRAGVGTLVCCDQAMTLQKENTTDAAREKHVPIVERGGGQLRVSVGSIPHPMIEAHYIEWVEVASGANTLHKHLRPGEPPAATFPDPGGDVVVRAYCNLHGLWKA
jgi:superoxide reductase